MAWAVQNNMYIDQYDLEGAYIHGYIDRLVYMQQPEGHLVPGQEHKVCRIIRSLYGLKQSGRCWYTRFSQVMQKHGMVRSFTDSCVFIIKINQHLGVVPIYVDDAPTMASSSEMRLFIKRVMTSEFKVRYVGPLSTLLGIEFKRFPDGSLELSQTQYIKKILTKYEMQDSNPAPTPLDPSIKLQKCMGASEREVEDMKAVPYRQAIGALMYIARATRYDIAYAVNALAQYGSRPEPGHWQAVKRIFRYLNGTLNHHLVYRKSENLLHLYADASLASDRDDRRSYSGVATFYGSCLVNWQATKQKSVSFSTMESEYRALGQATKEALWVRSLLQELGSMSPHDPPIKIYTDSMSALAHANSRIENSRTKYIDIACHFIREKIEDGSVELVYISTKYNLADIFTKPQQGPRHKMLMSKLNIFR